MVVLTKFIKLVIALWCARCMVSLGLINSRLFYMSLSWGCTKNMINVHSVQTQGTAKYLLTAAKGS